MIPPPCATMIEIMRNELTTVKTAPGEAAAPETASSEERLPSHPSTSRVLGLDAARGLAVLGMFAVHIGPPATSPGAGWMEIFAGRSAALFAVLAGVSLALLSGGAEPRRGRQGKQAMLRITVRALVIGAVGLALAQLHTPVMVILPYYALYFLLCLPLLRLRWQTLAIMAATLTVLGPIISFLIRDALGDDASGGSPVFANLTSLDGLRSGAQQLFLTGAYPALTWMPFVIAGLALGRDRKSVV